MTLKTLWGATRSPLIHSYQDDIILHTNCQMRLIQRWFGAMAATYCLLECRCLFGPGAAAGWSLVLEYHEEARSWCWCCTTQDPSRFLRVLFSSQTQMHFYSVSDWWNSMFLIKTRSVDLSQYCTAFSLPFYCYFPFGLADAAALVNARHFHFFADILSGTSHKIIRVWIE